MCLMQHIHKVSVQIVEQLLRHRYRYSEHCQTFKMESFTKGKGKREGVVELGSFDKGTS